MNAEERDSPIGLHWLFSVLPSLCTPFRFSADDRIQGAYPEGFLVKSRLLSL
jgi:hypothetical protein